MHDFCSHLTNRKLTLTLFRQNPAFGYIWTSTYRPGFSGKKIQACRYLMKDFGTSESPKSTRQRDSRYAPTV
ncbi:MAG: hypothetical protein KZQ65_05830, partial [Candidatus Thiodiazotropha sp. (ex Gloverina cf. vestifex)]|nr:hypothetical protein [Candidatus Thiodiazotropha sp. (ex Gloverina cf. vestifex)]